MSKINNSNPREGRYTKEVDINSLSRLWLLDSLNGKFGIKPFASFNNTGACDRMIDLSMLI